MARRLAEAGVAALCVFALVDLVLGAMSAHWRAGDVWIHGGGLPRWLVQGLVAAFAVAFLVVRPLQRRAEPLVRGLAVLVAVACLADAIVYYRLLATGRIATRLPLPLSLLLAALLLLWALARPRSAPERTARSRRALWVRVLDHSAPAWMLGFGLLLHLLTFGATDYRRPADAAVVFGASVRANGAASQALRDRILTACDLYHRGLVRTLVLSGGRDPRAPLSEPECMARIAREAGVPAEALVLDERGLTTDASVRSLRGLCDARGWRRVLMVSHDYHLARIAMTGRRAGLEVLTVPAEEPEALWAKPWFTLREMAAYALYYARS